MNRRKKHSATQGIVASEDLSTVYTREIFFQVDPATLDYLDAQKLRDALPRGNFIEFDPTPLLKYLPELEAEIFWLLYVKEKNQKDVATMLNISQPTVSYRYRRTLDKLSYLMVLASLDVKEMINQMTFLREREKEILYDLFFCVNQEMVGRKYNVRQSSVKWIFVKTRKRLEVMEMESPEEWSHHLSLMIFLERNLDIRVLH